MFCRRLFPVVVTLAWLCCAYQAVRAEDAAKPDRYMRVLFDAKDQPQAMETAIVRFKSTDPAKSDVYVDLIGAVHIGDVSYYDELNKEFEQYDALLYELVAPKGMRPPKGAKGGTGSLISQIQITMKRALALEFQLEKVDYEKTNFVHADMTPEQFSKSMKNLNEDPMTLFLRLMNASAKYQANSKRPPPSDLVILSAFFDRKRGPTILKRIFAEQLAEADVLLEALNGPGGSTIITERNKVALKVLDEELAAGKKKIGIFYGAAHMQDMEERLLKQVALKRDSVRWLKAWDLTAPTTSKSESKLPETGETDSRLASLDTLMRDVISKNEIPGGSLAVSYQGKLVYARGFGFSDVEKKEPVQPESLFRIASISKPITALAIFRLVEEGKLKLDDKVWTLLSLEKEVPSGKTADPRWKEITILQCLQHTAGFDREKSFDPMFRAMEFAKEQNVFPPAKPWDIIRAMLGRPLDFTPGERYAYSNFGYCLLGRVIEKVTGHEYGQFVQTAVFDKAGVKRTRLGRSLLSDRLEGEVRYYVKPEGTGPAVMGEKLGQQVPWPYGAWHLEAMDSHGAWVSSSVDLLRLGAALDRKDSPLLTAASQETMFTPSGIPVPGRPGLPKPNPYSAGWGIRTLADGSKTHEHQGSLDGTSTLLVHGENGISYAALFNTRNTPSGTTPANSVAPLLREAVSKIKDWPDKDLFSKLP